MAGMLKKSGLESCQFSYAKNPQKSHVHNSLLIVEHVKSLFAALILIALLAFPVSLIPMDKAIAAGEQNAPAVTLKYPPLSGIWKDIKNGEQGRISIRDPKASTLIQTDGQDWRTFRNGDLSRWGAYGLLGVLVLLVLFYFINGKVRIGAGRSDQTIERFAFLERAMHWLLAVSFILLALTGLNILYGKSLLLPIIGGSAFASLTQFGKWVHNFMGFSFMFALAWTLIVWIRHNFPAKEDLKWFAQGGGILSKQHPPAKKFNGGQKLIFWLVILGGLSLSLSGLALLMPFEWHLFAKTNAFLNIFGFNLPTELTPMQETQLAQQWHGVMSTIMIIIIICHIYIGSVGMEGAFDAMGSGEVDLNWAKEHHSLWVEEVQSKSAEPETTNTEPIKEEQQTT